MFDDSTPLFSPPTQQIGKLDSSLPIVHVPQKQGFADAIGQLFGDTTGSMWLAANGKKQDGSSGNPFGVPEDADEAMQMANQIRQQSSKSKGTGGGNGESLGNSIGDAAKFIMSLFG